MWKKLTSKKGIGIFILIMVGVIFCIWNRKTILNSFSQKEIGEQLSEDELSNFETENNSLKEQQTIEEILTFSYTHPFCNY